MLKTYATPLTINSLPNPTLNQFIATSLSALENATAAFDNQEQAALLVQKLKAEQETFNRLLHQEKTVSGTDLVRADKLRGTDLRNLFLQAKIHQHSRLANKKAAADDLVVFLTPYRSVYKENYEKETSAINSVLSRLEKSPYREKIALLGAKELVENLKQSQANFYQLYLNYSKYKRQEQTRSLSAQRQTVITAYTILYQYVLTLVAIDDTSNLKTSLTRLNEVRMDYHHRVKKSRQKKEPKKIDPNQHETLG